MVAQPIVSILHDPLPRPAGFEQLGYQDLRGTGLLAAKFLDKTRDIGHAVDPDAMNAEEPLRRPLVSRVHLHQLAERAAGRESAAASRLNDFRGTFAQLVARREQRLEGPVAVRKGGLFLRGPRLFVTRRLRPGGRRTPPRFGRLEPAAQTGDFVLLRPDPRTRSGEAPGRVIQAGGELPATPRKSQSGRRQALAPGRVLVP